MNDQNGNNTNTADNADAANNAGSEGTQIQKSKKSKMRRFSGYALKGAVGAAAVTGLYFGIRALLGSAGDVAADVLAGTADAVGAVA
jgi:hypothetical protein